MSEFDKLDSFVKRNVPEMKKTLRPLRLEKKASLFWGIAVSGALATVVTFININQRVEKIETVTELAETLSWDVTTDEMPEEVSEVLSFAEEE